MLKVLCQRVWSAKENGHQGYRPCEARLLLGSLGDLQRTADSRVSAPSVVTQCKIVDLVLAVGE